MKNKKKILFSICFFIIYVFLILSSQVFAGTLSSDINGINDSKYPQFKSMIQGLQQSNSNFNFQVYYTGIDWQEAITREYQGHGSSPRNLFNYGTNYKGMWYCQICGEKTFESGKWSCASRDAIGYMMDPRNSLNIDSVYQFKTLETADATVADIQREVRGTFLDTSETIQAIYDASVSQNINAYFVIARILTEQGNTVTSLTSGNYPGYQGYYNYFNIDAWGSNDEAIITRGLEYAKKNGWNSIRNSIIGGVSFIRAEYIGKGQNTMYYQRFNSAPNDSSKLFTHQYQANVMAAETEGRKLKSYYKSIVNHTFIIPLYENMPYTASPRPDTARQSKYGYEEGVISVNGTLKVRATPNGAEIAALNNGESIKILSRASTTVNGLYWDLIVSDKLGYYGYSARGEGARTYLIGNGKFVGGDSAEIPVTPTTPPPVEPQKNALSPNTMTVEDSKILNTISVSPDIMIEKVLSTYPGIVVKDLAGNILNSGTICTGYIASIRGVDYTLVKKGDVDGNGVVFINDAVLILNHLSGSIPITDTAKLKATQITPGLGYTFITDVVSVLNYLIGM